MKLIPIIALGVGCFSTLTMWAVPVNEAEVIEWLTDRWSEDSSRAEELVESIDLRLQTASGIEAKALRQQRDGYLMPRFALQKLEAVMIGQKMRRGQIRDMPSESRVASQSLAASRLTQKFLILKLLQFTEAGEGAASAETRESVRKVVERADVYNISFSSLIQEYLKMNGVASDVVDETLRRE